jgi:hypothetical protein
MKQTRSAVKLFLKTFSKPFSSSTQTIPAPLKRCALYTHIPIDFSDLSTEMLKPAKGGLLCILGGDGQSRQYHHQKNLNC